MAQGAANRSRVTQAAGARSQLAATLGAVGQLGLVLKPFVEACNVPLHLVTVPGNRTHEGLLRLVPTSHGPLTQFITASHYIIVSTVPIVIDMTHYVIVTTVFPPNTLFCTIAL